MGEKRVWGVSRGNQGSITDPLTEIVRANQADAERRRMERKDEAEQLEHQVKIKGLEKQAKGEDEAVKSQLAQENEQLKEEVHKKEIQLVAEKLGGQIAQLGKSIQEGADKKTITEQVAEVKQVATDIGLGGGSKFTDVQEALDLVERLKPAAKTLPEQVKDAKDLIDTFGQKTDGGSMAFEIEKMKGDRELAMEQMRDERAGKDREWQLKIKQWEEEREDKKAQIMAEIQTKREGNELLANGIQKLGEVLVAAKGAGVGAATGAIANQIVQAVSGEQGEISCQKCQTIIPISGTDTQLTCPGCGAKYEVQRTPSPEKTEEGVSG